MKRITTIALACICASLLVAAGATAGKGNDKGKAKGADNPRALAAKECAAEKRADKAAFKAVYGKRAMRTCIKGEKGEAREDIRNAAGGCRAERDADREGFRDQYGTEKSKGNNAFGKCVSQKSRQEAREDAREFKNAAKQCRAERDADSEGFRDQYGSEKSKGKNAFGKCVSQKSSDRGEGQPET